MRAPHLRRPGGPAIGATAGFLVGAWLLTGGRRELFRWQQFGDFYDAQAHSLLHGHLAIDPHVLGIEAFFSHGRAYMYQGPVPALLRLPVVALAGDRLDGRLTVLSMLTALAVLARALVRVERRVRTVARGDDALGRREHVLLGVTLGALVAGAPILFQSSRAWIYHEAVLWGIAFALLAVEQLVRHSLTTDERVRVRALCWGTVATTAAVLTRVSIGLGPLVALVALAVRSLVRRDRPTGRAALAHAAAALVPAVAYVGVNLAKFHAPVSVPFRGQKQALVDPARQAFLDANHGSFFGLHFVPTTLLHYLDPRGIRPGTAFPFVDFPRLPGPVVGGVRFDLLDRAAGLPAAAPLLVVLTAVAAVALVRRADLAALRLPFLAALASAAAVLPFGYVAQRYLGDAAPFLAVGSILGIHVWLRAEPARRWLRPVVDGTLVVLAALTAWSGVGLALDYQRLWSTNVAPATTAGFLAFRDHLGARLAVERGDVLPAHRPEGSLFALGDCDALYLADGLPVTAVNRSSWHLVEGTAASGHWRLRLRFGSVPVGAVVPILTSGTAAAPNVLVARSVDAHHVRFEYHPTSGVHEVGRPVRIERDRLYDAELVADWRIDRLALTVGDVVVLESYYGERSATVSLGSDPFTGPEPNRFPGTFEVRRTGAPLCRELTGTRGAR